MTAADAVVVDASAVVRALSTAHQIPEAMRAIERRAVAAHAPDLIAAEVASALATGARSRAYSLEEARKSYELYSAYPIRLHRSGLLALNAIELSATSRLSVYDALYAVLASALDVPLVTADRRLADAVPGSVLVS